MAESTLRDFFDMFGGTKQERALKAEKKQLIDTLAGSPDSSNEGLVPQFEQERFRKSQKEALIRLSTIDPTAAQIIQGVIKNGDEIETKLASDEAKKGTKRAIYVMGGKTIDEKRNRLLEIAKNARLEGEDASKILDMVYLGEDELRVKLERMRVMGQEIETLLKPPGQAKTLVKDGVTATGIFKQDPATGQQILTDVKASPFQQEPKDVQETWEPVFDKDKNIIGQKSSKSGKVVADPRTKTAPDALEKWEPVFDKDNNIIGQKSSKTGKVIADPRTQKDQKDATPFSKLGKLKSDLDRGLITKEQFQAEVDSAPEFAASAKTQIYKNGTAVAMMPNGKTTVLDPSGKRVTGQERLDVLREAQKEEIKFAGVKAGTVKASETSIKKSDEAIEKIGGLKIAIQNLDDGIKALNEGAQTGPIVSKLPSVRQASIVLDNVQKKLGLDVIQNTTFGALSEAELQFALSSALPTNMKPQALKQWMIEKRDAQKKLIKYLEDAAIFLGTPGATQAEWLRLQRDLREKMLEGTGGKDLKEMTNEELLSKF